MTSLEERVTGEMFGAVRIASLHKARKYTSKYVCFYTRVVYIQNKIPKMGQIKWTLLLATNLNARLSLSGHLISV